jgi:hypothetical protein
LWRAPESSHGRRKIQGGVAQGVGTAEVKEYVCSADAVHTTLATIMCAVHDALVPLDVQSRETPLLPNRIWTLIQQVKGCG